MKGALTILGVILTSLLITILITIGIVAAVDNANRGTIEACERLGGGLIQRGYICVLPTGEVVDPERWEEHHGEVANK